MSIFAGCVVKICPLSTFLLFAAKCVTCTVNAFIRVGEAVEGCNTSTMLVLLKRNNYGEDFYVWLSVHSSQFLKGEMFNPKDKR